MKLLRAATAASFILLTLATRMIGAPPDEQKAGADFFESRIRPVLIEHCYKCHSDREAKVKGGLHLDSRAGMLKGGESGRPAVVPGDADGSRLIVAIRQTDPELTMPPKSKLSAQQIADFVAWVQQGAPGPRDGDAGVSARRPATTELGKDHWAFKQPVNAPAPPVKQRKWARNDIDRFVLAKLEAKGLPPSPEADRRTLIRRVSYDLTGLPPTDKEVDAFVADRSPDAYEQLVDRLLASPRYGERWGRYWLDLARYSDSKGYVYAREERFWAHAHVYRDWVTRAFNEDLPYDQFLLKQLAADQLVPADAADNRDLAAMGFLTLGRRFLNVTQDVIDDRIDVVTRTTMGLSAACARCHDHKFDPIPTQDYYSLYGVFMNCTERTVPLEPSPKAAGYDAYQAELKKRTEKYETEWTKRRDKLMSIRRTKSADYLLAVLDVEKLPVDLFGMQLTENDLNPLAARRWDGYLRSRAQRGFDPIFATWHVLAAIPKDRFAEESPEVLKKLLADAGDKLNPLVAEMLAKGPPASMADLARAYGKLLSDTDAQWRETSKQQPAIAALPDAAREALRQVLYASDSPVNIPDGAITDVENYYDEPSREVLNKAQGEIDRWNINTPAAPPLATILVDAPFLMDARVFKRGNAATPGEDAPRRFLGAISGFGDRRKPFTIGSGRLEMARAIATRDNPLTARVMVNRIWQHHFGVGIVTTPSDFGTRADQPSHPELLDHLAIDFMNDGWSIKRLHKKVLLSATYRQASGDNAVARAIDPENHLLWRQNRSRLDFEATRDSLLLAAGHLDLTAGGRPVEMFQPPFSTRRTVYGKIDRQYVPGVLRVFDFANPDLHIPSRPSTTVPQQALFFMNSPFVVQQAKALAQRAEVTSAATPAERVRQLFRIVYQRDATPAQVADAEAFIAATHQQPIVTAPKFVENAWRYGYAEYDIAKQKLGEFHPLPHFTGMAWQGGPMWPDKKLGWVQLTAEGGHAGNDLQHAAVRRWVAPREMTIAIQGVVRHAETAGDGIRAHVVSSRHGHLISWTLHDRSANMTIEPLAVSKGDTIDFVVDVRENLNNDMFTWAITIHDQSKAPPAGEPAEWNARKDFGGPTPTPPPALTSWEAYAQVLLLSNEFLFVD